MFLGRGNASSPHAQAQARTLCASILDNCQFDASHKITTTHMPVSSPIPHSPFTCHQDESGDRDESTDDGINTDDENQILVPIAPGK